MSECAPFPVDDVALALVEHALTAKHRHDENGNLLVFGADMNMPQLLSFLSGYDPDLLFTTSDLDVDDYLGDSQYHRDDVIRALIAEVRRLRHD